MEKCEKLFLNYPQIPSLSVLLVVKCETTKYGHTSRQPAQYFYFFHFANFVIFWLQILWKCCDSGYLVSATPHTILYRSFWDFVHIFTMVWTCAYGLDIILELIFITFSTLWTLSFSDLKILWKSRDSGYLVSATLIQFYTNLYETLHTFLPWSGDVHMVWI